MRIVVTTGIRFRHGNEGITATACCYGPQQDPGEQRHPYRAALPRGADPGAAAAEGRRHEDIEMFRVC